MKSNSVIIESVPKSLRHSKQFCNFKEEIYYNNQAKMRRVGGLFLKIIKNTRFFVIKHPLVGRENE